MKPPSKMTVSGIHSLVEKSVDLAGLTASSTGVALYSSKGRKTLQGTTGNDVLIGGPNDTLSGGGGRGHLGV